jgi:hypothetical protein
MRISKSAILQGLFCLLLLASYVSSFKPAGYVKTKAFSLALIHSDDLWQEYTLLKYELFCEGSDGRLLIRNADPKKLFRFKEVAMKSQEAELLLPFSEQQKLADIETHLQVFDDETTYRLSSLDNDHQQFKEKQACTPSTQNQKPVTNSTAETNRNERHTTVQG